MPKYPYDPSGYQASSLANNQRVPNLDFMEMQTNPYQGRLPAKHEFQSSTAALGPSLWSSPGRNRVSSVRVPSSRSLPSNGINTSFKQATLKPCKNIRRTKPSLDQRRITKPSLTAKHNELYTPQIKTMVSQSYAATSKILGKHFPLIEGEVTEILQRLNLLILTEYRGLKNSEVPRVNPTGLVAAARPRIVKSGFIRPNAPTTPNCASLPSQYILPLLRNRRHQIQHQLRVINTRLQQGVAYSGAEASHSSVFEPEALKEDKSTTEGLNHLTALMYERQRWRRMQSAIDVAKKRIQPLCGRLQSLTIVWNCLGAGNRGPVLDRASFNV